MKTKLLSMAMRHQDSVERQKVKSYFAQENVTPKNIPYMSLQRKVVYYTGSCVIRTQTMREIIEVASSAIVEMKRGDVLIWDRLGRSGRCVNPIRQHYKPRD